MVGEGAGWPRAERSLCITIEAEINYYVLCLEQINSNCGNKVLTSRPNEGEGSIVVQPAGHHLIIRIPAQLQAEKNMALCATYCRKNEEHFILFLINIFQVLLV